MRTILISIVAMLLVAGCSDEPEPAKKPPMRFIVETQRPTPYIVTMWSTTPTVPIGNNLFKLQFQTLENQPADPGPIDLQPILIETGKPPVPGRAEVKRAEEAGVYDVKVDLPQQGRWRMNVSFGSHRIAFYYTARQAVPGEGANEAGKAR
jgi:hypothetical protein